MAVIKVCIYTKLKLNTRKKFVNKIKYSFINIVSKETLKVKGIREENLTIKFAFIVIKLG